MIILFFILLALSLFSTIIVGGYLHPDFGEVAVSGKTRTKCIIAFVLSIIIMAVSAMGFAVFWAFYEENPRFETGEPSLVQERLLVSVESSDSSSSSHFLFADEENFRFYYETDDEEGGIKTECVPMFRSTIIYTSGQPRVEIYAREERAGFTFKEWTFRSLLKKTEKIYIFYVPEGGVLDV